MNRYYFSIAMVAAAVLAAPPEPRAGPEGCITDWSVAARVVERESLATVEDVTRRMSAEKAGNVVKTVLCESGGSYVYRVTIRDAKGALKNMTVDARRGK